MEITYKKHTCMDWIDSSSIKSPSCYARVVPSTDTRQPMQLSVALVSLDPMPTGLHRNQDICATQKLIQGRVSACCEHTYKYASKQMSENARVFLVLTVSVVLSKC